MLAAGTVAQVALISDRAADRTEPAQPVRTLAPVAAKQPTEISQLRLANAPSGKPRARQKSKAEQLAEKYRRQGYRVPDRLARQIHAAAVENGIDPAIAFGLVRTESGFRNSATSHVGATGLTQLMPATARWMEPGTTRAELRDSETNLRIGFRYLRRLLNKYDGDTTLALLAYNRGPGTVDRLVRRGRDPDNGYADMVRGLRTTHR